MNLSLLGCRSMFYSCSAKTAFQLWEIWSRASDEQSSSLIIRPDGWGPEPGKGRRKERDGGGAFDKKDGERWRVSGKERVVERDLQKMQCRESDGEKDEQRGDMQAATEEDPSNKLPSPPLQRLSTWTPLSALIHTHACLCHTRSHIHNHL